MLVEIVRMNAPVRNNEDISHFLRWKFRHPVGSKNNYFETIVKNQLSRIWLFESEIGTRHPCLGVYEGKKRIGNVSIYDCHYLRYDIADQTLTLDIITPNPMGPVGAPTHDTTSSIAQILEGHSQFQRVGRDQRITATDLPDHLIPREVVTDSPLGVIKLSQVLPLISRNRKKIRTLGDIRRANPEGSTIINLEFGCIHQHEELHAHQISVPHQRNAVALIYFDRLRRVGNRWFPIHRGPNGLGTKRELLQFIEFMTGLADILYSKHLQLFLQLVGDTDTHDGDDDEDDLTE